MLSVIVTPGDPDRLPGLLAMLTAAAVEGLVRDVQLLPGPPQPLLEAVCAESGAEPAADFSGALAAARSDLVLVAPPELRLADGWVERLAIALRDGARTAVLQGQGGGLFRRGPFGVLLPKAQAASVGPDLQRLRRIGRARAQRVL